MPDRKLIPKLSFFLLEKLMQEGLMERSGTTIQVDTEGKVFVDPGQGWAFSANGYIAESKLLVVRAVPVDRDDAQRVIVTALR